MTKVYCGNKYIKIKDPLFQSACKQHDTDYDYIKRLMTNSNNKAVLHFMKKEADKRFLDNMLLAIRLSKFSMITERIKIMKAYCMYYAVRLLKDSYIVN